MNPLHSEAPDSAAFEVLPYDAAQFRQLLVAKSGASAEMVECRTHTTYLSEYFDKLGAKTIVVENCYIDRDFLEDFSAYYVRCFRNYKRFCSRLHFFSSSFAADEFNALLGGRTGSISFESLNQDYLGFIVIKPLPQTIIGRTCLKTYPDEPGKKRNYPIIQTNKAMLFGIELRIHSLPFQEQDRVAAACATSALWSAFQGTGHLFQHRIPSPVEITQSANDRFPVETRTLPSAGLTIQQMAHAICSVGLEPLAINVTENKFLLRGTAHAYLKAGLPVLLICNMFQLDTSGWQFIGKHAVALAGFGTHNSDPPEPSARTKFLSSASAIDRFYAHDDQVGPFARMELDGQTVKCDGREWMSLSTNWGVGTADHGKIRAVPETLLIPLYHKIRIPFSQVEDAVIEFDALLEFFRFQEALPLTQRLIWDIHLTTLNEIKSEVFNDKTLAEKVRCQFLLGNMPRFMWRAKALSADMCVLDLLFDATDIEQGHIFITAIERDLDLAAVIQTIARHEQVEAVLRGLESVLGAFRSIRDILTHFK